MFIIYNQVKMQTLAVIEISLEISRNSANFRSHSVLNSMITNK